MNTKRYLLQIELYDKRIQNKLSELYQLRAMACNVSISPDKEKIQSSGEKDRLGTAVAKIVDLENETNHLCDQYIDKRKKIVAQIESIDDANMYNVLFQRYVLYYSLKDIAVNMNYSEMQINRIHGKALAEFEKRFGIYYLAQNSMK